MRAKKGTRIATATELLLVEPLVSGSVSVIFSLTLKPGGKILQLQKKKENNEYTVYVNEDYFNIQINKETNTGKTKDMYHRLTTITMLMMPMPMKMITMTTNWKRSSRLIKPKT